MTPAQEIRFAARSARKAPVFTLTVLATLALVIGVNTAIFTVVDGALLRALPYPSPERLVEVATVIETPRGRTTRTGQDGRVWEGLRENVRSLDLGVWSTGATRVNFVHDANVRLVQLQRVGSGFFRNTATPITPTLSGRPVRAAYEFSCWVKKNAATRCRLLRQPLMS